MLKAFLYNLKLLLRKVLLKDNKRILILDKRHIIIVCIIEYFSLLSEKARIVCQYLRTVDF